MGALKRFTRMVFNRSTWRMMLMPNSRFDYASAVGDGTSSSLVASVLNWIARTFPEAPPALWQEDADGQETQIRDHPMLKLLRKPNDYYTGIILWMATVVDWVVDGNAYWLKVRDQGGQVIELWWVPHHMIKPVGDEATFISHYEYSPNAVPIEISPDDIVHFRFGADADDTRMGYSQLKSVLREVFTDDEAANFTASLLRNMGVPGIILSPEKGVTLNVGDADSMKEYVHGHFGGDKRGEAMVMTGATKVEQFGFSPEQLVLRDLRRIPEERVSAATGIPAIVVGFGAGLERSTFCLPGDARVWTPAGPAEIRDVREGQIVWSFAGGGLEPRRVTYAGCTGAKPLLRIRTKNRTVRATGNHPFLVRVPGSMTKGANHDRHPSVAWRRADELRVGDHVVQPKSLPDQGGTTLSDGTPATRAMLQFLGALTGDGTVSGPGVRMAMPPSDRCVATYRALAEGLFTKQARSSGGGVEVQDTLERAPVVIQERERDFGFSSAQAARTLVALGLGGRAHTKRVPSWVWGLSRELRLAFLAGLVDTDGAIDKRGALTFTFCNRALTHDTRDLLVSVGIQACNVAAKTVPNRLPNPGLHDSYPAWTFTASSARQVAEIPFADPLYRERVEANHARHRSDGFDAHKAGLSADLGFYEIKEISDLPAEPIYDLTIEGSHSFVADGVVVHNTNMGEARAAAYEAGLIPMQRIMAEEILFQLLDDFEDDVYSFRFGFDLTKVRVLQEDLYRLAQRHDLAVRGGWEKVAEARRALGLPIDADDDVYLRMTNVIATDGTGPDAPDPAAPPPGGANGHLPEQTADAVVAAIARRELITG